VDAPQFVMMAAITAARDPTGPPDRARLADAVDVLIVGAGSGGLYALYKLRGMGLTAVVLETVVSDAGAACTARLLARLDRRVTAHIEPRHAIGDPVDVVLDRDEEATAVRS